MSALALMVGAPGAGKSTWVGDTGLSKYSLSLDTLRCMYTGREDDFSMEPLCVSMLHSIATNRLVIKKVLTVIDNTNYLAEYRKPLIELARVARLPVIAVVFNVDAAECQRRDEIRGKKIKDDTVIPRFWAGVQQSMVTLPDEVDTVVTVGSDGTYTITGDTIPHACYDCGFPRLDSR